MKRVHILLILLLISLFLLLGIFFRQYPATMELALSMPVKYINLPSDLILAGQPLKEVEVRIGGGKSVIKAFSEQEPSCALDLSGISAGMVTLSVEESSFHFPAGISALHIEPTSITLRVESKQVKTVPVSVTLADNPMPGYRVVLTLASPSALQIIGSEKSLAPIDQLTTRPISVKDATESFKKETTVDLPNGVAIGGGETSVVTAQINIEENIIVRRFEAIPVEGRNSVLSTKITPPNIDIEVRGPENTLSELTVGDDVKAYVDLEGLAPGTYARRVNITLPVGTTVAGYDPEVFTVTVGN